MTCGTGTQQRTHACANPTAANGGASCAGVAAETQDCAPDSCPSKWTKGMYAFSILLQTKLSLSYCVLCMF